MIVIRQPCKGVLIKKRMPDIYLAEREVYKKTHTYFSSIPFKDELEWFGWNVEMRAANTRNQIATSLQWAQAEIMHTHARQCRGLA